MTKLIWLPESGATANEELARFHEWFLAAGPVGWIERADDMRWLLDQSFTNGGALWKMNGTTCAFYQGAAMQTAGIQERRKSPRVTGITTWMAASWFSGPEWIPIGDVFAGKAELQRGDIPYWCGYAKSEPPARWQQALNGHVGCILAGRDFLWTTAEGGGANGRCKLSAGAKDVLLHTSRPLRGVWRPNEMRSSILTVRDEMPTNPDGFLELHRGSKGPRVGQWQIELLRLGYQLPKFGADSDFGGETEAATRAFQIKNTIPNTGVVDRRTWETARALEK